MMIEVQILEPKLWGADLVGRAFGLRELAPTGTVLPLKTQGASDSCSLPNELVSRRIKVSVQVLKNNSCLLSRDKLRDCDRLRRLSSFKVNPCSYDRDQLRDY